MGLSLPIIEDKMRMRRFSGRILAGLILTGFASLSGCQTGFDFSRSGQSSRSPDAGLISALSVIPVSGLGPQTLAPGECGLFLWSKTDLSKFIFFSKAQSGQAVMAQGEVVRSLTQTRTEGEIFGQFTTSMRFAVRRPEQNITLEFEAGEMLEDGQRIERGLLTASGQDGWRTKLPVLGVRACQPLR